MMRKIKKNVKTIISTIMHPIFSKYLRKTGCKSYSIGARLVTRNIQSLHCGNNFTIGYDARILFFNEYAGNKYSPCLQIGDNVQFGNRCTILCASPIEIGGGSLFASDILISSENHGMNPEDKLRYAAQPLIAKSVKIGEGCWIGEKVSILPGVELGEKCIVATGAVVTKSFPAYSMIGGVPAKIIKQYSFETHRWE